MCSAPPARRHIAARRVAHALASHRRRAIAPPLRRPLRRYCAALAFARFAVAGREKATGDYLQLDVYSLPRSAGDEPCLDQPITLRQQYRVRGVPSENYLMQFNNDENRAFLDHFTTEHSHLRFPAHGIGMRQDAETLLWKHKPTGDAPSLSDHYDFEVVGQGEGNSAALSASGGAEVAAAGGGSAAAAAAAGGGGSAASGGDAAVAGRKRKR